MAGGSGRMTAACSPGSIGPDQLHLQVIAVGEVQQVIMLKPSDPNPRVYPDPFCKFEDGLP